MIYCICYLVFHCLVCVVKGVNVCVYVGEGLRCSFATPNSFVLTNKICVNQYGGTGLLCICVLSDCSCLYVPVPAKGEDPETLFSASKVRGFKMHWTLGAKC